ncbi:MAG: tRNA methyltransferase [Candidatus Pelagibacter sp.]|jgi:tRNA (cytidine/uridine-2'-O-)-methyltransferase|nr:tRNA methyltransferase [Candidatus Pelagibacter sp.]MDP6440125.1 tRNA (cytidine(34)-2'-O)-methyltransferase [Pelagibacteraceae bacterium]|tara:strand:+ start:4381 stop:4860 length:480 start_codon:yes stop_codon:yes gene_type:complete
MTQPHSKNSTLIKVALYEPDIPQNTAAIVRLCACFGVRLDIIEPCGFFLSDKRFKRVVMDYINECKIKSFKNFTEFKKDKKNERIILMTTKAKRKYFDFKFNQNDTILFGRESAGVPQLVHKSVDYKLIIPIQKKDRSLNIVSSVAITLAEALKQNQCL